MNISTILIVVIAAVTAAVQAPDVGNPLTDFTLKLSPAVEAKIATVLDCAADVLTVAHYVMWSLVVLCGSISYYFFARATKED